MADSVLAAQLYTVRDFVQTPDDIRTSFRRIRDLGYEAVQTSGLGPMPATDLKQLAEEADLKIIATHVSYERIASEPESVIDDHLLWNCRHVGIGGLPAEYRVDDGYRRFAADASRAAAPLIEAGLTFNYHNHSFEFERFGQQTGYEILFEHSDPRLFSAEVDTYWVQHGGANPASWLRRLSDRLHIVHLKDMAVVDGKQTFAEVGEGNLEWEDILLACREAQIEWYIVEQDTCAGDPFESLGISFRNLRRMGIH